MIDMQRLTDLFALNQNLYFALLHDGVINFLALLRTDVTDKLWRHLRRVKDVVAQHRTDKWHDECIFRCFFRLDCCALQPNFGG